MRFKLCCIYILMIGLLTNCSVGNFNMKRPRFFSKKKKKNRELKAKNYSLQNGMEVSEIEFIFQKKDFDEYLTFKDMVPKVKFLPFKENKIYVKYLKAIAKSKVTKGLLIDLNLYKIILDYLFCNDIVFYVPFRSFTMAAGPCASSKILEKKPIYIVPDTNIWINPVSRSWSFLDTYYVDISKKNWNLKDIPQNVYALLPKKYIEEASDIQITTKGNFGKWRIINPKFVVNIYENIGSEHFKILTLRRFKKRFQKEEIAIIMGYVKESEKKKYFYLENPYKAISFVKYDEELNQSLWYSYKVTWKHHKSYYNTFSIINIRNSK